ncbi:lipopolysaccharide biosynthesis protein RfbH [Methylomonas sp. YC3]
MESLVVDSAFSWGKSVFLTGHTGFKGVWLALWLQRLGDKVSGLALTPEPRPYLYGIAQVADGMHAQIGDVNDLPAVLQVVQQAQLEIMMHLAAQPLVRRSYADPLATYQANVMGTLRVLEAIRSCSSVKPTVMVTTDKCHDNREWLWSYRESDGLGGYDPYSSRKACMEILVAAYRNSYFYQGVVAIVTARAGKLIGGGDWAQDRLVPDLVRALDGNRAIVLRNPLASRSWPHVLEPLAGHLLLAECLYRERKGYAEAWSFGPGHYAHQSVGWIVDCVVERWPKLSKQIDANEQQHEAYLLTPDSSKARARLGWHGYWNLYRALEKKPGQVRKSSSGTRYEKPVLDPNRLLQPIGRVRMSQSTELDALRAEIPGLVGRYAELAFAAREFLPGVTPIAPSGKVVGVPELQHLVESSLDGWLTTGRFNCDFESQLAAFIGAKHLLTVNSGSSANLLAVAALTSPQLGGRALQAGDEVITVAAGFPTAVNPLLHYGLVPVFVDIVLPTYNIDVDQIEAAISPKTKAIMLAHTLGNPFDLTAIIKLARRYGLWLIEGCCDALGSTYTPFEPIVDAQGKTIQAGETHHVGTFGDIGTLSFYPAHQITMGEGGAVFTSNGVLKRILELFRDWGRDCFCEPGRDNTCRKRFEYQLGELPFGFDHKYTYSHAGYNMKITDMQAACGLAQLSGLPGFVASRQENFTFLKAGLANCEAYLLLPEPAFFASPAWFGFPITIKDPSAVQRANLIRYLEQHKIGTRLLFGGNLTCQPYMMGRHFRVVGELLNTNKVMRNTFWVGVQPSLNREVLAYIAATILCFLRVNPQ